MGICGPEKLFLSWSPDQYQPAIHFDVPLLLCGSVLIELSRWRKLCKASICRLVFVKGNMHAK